MICSRARQQQQASGVRKPMGDHGRDLDFRKLGPHVNIGVDRERFQKHGEGVSTIVRIVQSPGLIIYTHMHTHACQSQRIAQTRCHRHERV